MKKSFLYIVAETPAMVSLVKQLRANGIPIVCANLSTHWGSREIIRNWDNHKNLLIAIVRSDDVTWVKLIGDGCQISEVDWYWNHATNWIDRRITFTDAERVAIAAQQRRLALHKKMLKTQI